MQRAPHHLGCDLPSLWHRERPASLMRSPLSGPGSVARKLHIKPDGVLSFETGEHVFQLCKEKSTGDFVF